MHFSVSNCIFSNTLKHSAMTNKKHVGIWVRVSSDLNKGDSPEHHEQKARAYISAKGWEVGEIYRLEAVSGKTIQHLPETKRMLSDIRTKRISGIVFSRLARVARNTKELLDLWDIFKEHEADLICLEQSLDTTTPVGKLMYTVLAALAEWERNETSERVAASVPVRAKLGKPLGGQASYGYTWKNNTLVINEVESPVRKLIYELFLDIRRKQVVARTLNERGYRTRNGSKWSDNTVERLLRDPTAKGIHRANYTKSRGDGKGWDLKPEKDWVTAPCPAIVSAELWNQCNLILDEQFKPRTRTGKLPKYLLTGFVYCACGKKMYVFGEAYLCRECKRRILATDMDEIFQTQLKAYLTETSEIQYREQSDADIKEKELLLKQAKHEYATIFKKAQDTLDLRLAGELTKELFTPLYKPIEERLLQLNDYIPYLEAEIDILKMNILSSETVIEEARTLYEQWQTAPFEQKRGIVEIITESITVEDQDITITLATLSAPSTSSQNGLNNRPTRKGS